MKARIINLVSFLFITMFTYAAVSKWLTFNVFVYQINKQPFDHKFMPFLIWGIPISEIVVSVLMMFEKTRTSGLKIATGMMIVFTGYIVLIKMNFFDKIPCSCGGAITQLTWTQHLIFNLFFVLAGVLAILVMKGNRFTSEN
jgi:putative oxidoreductase